MLEELLKFNKLGSKDELLFVLFEALPTSSAHSKNDLRKFCVSNQFSISGSFNGIIKLLEFISFIKINDDKVFINKDLFNPSFQQNKESYFIEPDFIYCLFNSLKTEKCIDLFFNPDSLKYDFVRDKYYIKGNLIPYKYFPLRNLLITIGFLEWDIEIKSNHLVVNSIFNKIFKQIVDWIIEVRENSKKKRSITQLKKDLERKEEVGKEAEMFVLQFENQRLINHPRISSIKRISEEFVNAGYDIESFNDIETIIIDRFIEVKSYSDVVSFFWTKTEVKIAQTLGDKYFLYLVDRLQMNVSGYKPKVFQNPYEKIFENEFWKKETDTWKITLEK